MLQIRSILNSLARIFYISLGFFIIIYIIYVRLILQRLPRDLNLFNPNFNWKLFLVVLSGISISSYIIINNVYKLFVNSNNINDSFYKRFLIKISTIVDRALNEVSFFIINKLPNNYEIISAFAKRFYKLFGRVHESFFLMISFSCKFFVVFIFSVDIFYFYRLDYFYKSLILFCIPLIINVLFYQLRDFSENFDDISATLVVTEFEGSDKIIYRASPGNQGIDVSYHVEELERCGKIKGYLEAYDFYVNYYSPKFNIIIFSLYLIGWLYILITNIA